MPPSQRESRSSSSAMRSPLAWFLVVAMVGAAMAGCSSTGSPLSSGSPPNGGNGGFPPQVGTAYIRVINGSPDYLTPTGADIDVYIDGTRVWQNVPYANFNGKAGGVATSPYYVTSIAQV